MHEEEGDLPNIDDLQIAAGAAAGKKDPVWPVLRKALGEENVSDEDSEGEETSGQVGAEQGDEEMPAASSEVRGPFHMPDMCSDTMSSHFSLQLMLACRQGNGCEAARSRCGCGA